MKWPMVLGLVVLCLNVSACGDDDDKKGEIEDPFWEPVIRDYDVYLIGILAGPARSDRAPWDGPEESIDPRFINFIDQYSREPVLSDDDVSDILDYIDVLPEKPDLMVEWHDKRQSYPDVYTFPGNRFAVDVEPLYLGTTCPTCVYVSTNLDELQIYDSDALAHDYSGSVRLEQSMAELVFKNRNVAWVNVMSQTDGAIVALRLRAIESVPEIQ